MFPNSNVGYVLIALIFLSCASSCKQKHAALKKEIVKVPEEMDDQITDNIKAVLQYANDNNGVINDSVKLFLPGVVTSFYDKYDYRNIWSRKEKWLPIADSMFSFIEHAKYYGLFPEDYHYRRLVALREKITGDSSARTDAVIWTKADLLLSDAFMKTAKDLKEGRLVPDTASIVRKQRYIDSFFVPNLNAVRHQSRLTDVFDSMEPRFRRYQSLKNLVKNFVDSMHNTNYQFVTYPENDSELLVKNIQERLFQGGFAKTEDEFRDSILFSNEVKKYQASHKLKKDGRIGVKLVQSLNSFDVEKFKRIAVTLDRYKLMSDTLPLRYIWVNLPGYYLEVWDHDTLTIHSKVIVGKPTTRTPVLASSITDMVTYPQWTIPESIIKKDILPGLKKDPGYLAAKGFNLVDSKGDVVDPYKIKWTRYVSAIPWKIMQGSGDDNALGIFKFNFNNPYSVYLHDTNQRYLFANADRDLSHGCVRVQKWEDLAFYIARNDSLNKPKDQRISYNVDSIKTWLANKDRKRIFVKSRLPVFFEYFTCEAKNDKIVFFEDIYGDDQMLADKYFANK